MSSASETTSPLTVAQTAKRLNVSIGVIYKEIHRKRLPCYQIGGIYRITEEHLADYLANSEMGTLRVPKEFKHVKKLGGR